MKDTEVNKEKRELIQEYGLASCKIAVKHLIATGFAHSEEGFESFKDVVGYVYAGEIRDIIKELESMDRKTALQIVKRLL